MSLMHRHAYFLATYIVLLLNYIILKSFSCFGEQAVTNDGVKFINSVAYYYHSC